MNSYICQICEVPHFSHEITQHICPHCKQVMKAKMEFIKKSFQCVMAALMLIIIIGFAVFGCSGCGTSTSVTQTFDKDGRRISKTIETRADTLHHKAFNLTSTTYGAKVEMASETNPFPTFVIGFESVAVNAVPVITGQGFTGENYTSSPVGSTKLNEMKVEIKPYQSRIPITTQTDTGKK